MGAVCAAIAAPALSGMQATVEPQILALLIAGLGIAIAFFDSRKARRRAGRWLGIGGLIAGGLVFGASVLPSLSEIAAYWPLALLVIVVPIATALLIGAYLSGARRHALRQPPNNFLHRLVSRVLMRIRRPVDRRTRDRRIHDVVGESTKSARK